MSAQVEAIWKLLWEYIANEDSAEDYSAEMAERLCECVLPLVWNEVAQLEAENERLLKIEKICQRLFEKEDHVAKYIKVEGEGDTWHIPEAIGLALLEALEG